MSGGGEMAASGFSLVDGGLFCRLIRRLGWIRAPDGRCDYLRVCIVLVAVTWGPLLGLSVAERVLTGEAPAIDWGIQARLLIALPLLFRAEASLHKRTRQAIGIFRTEHWAPEQEVRITRIIAATARLRDSVLPELVLLGIAFVGGQTVVWRGSGAHSLVQGLILDPQLVAPKYWYALVSLPVFQFLVTRSLWRWGLWTHLLWRLSRLNLRPIPTHPDLAGGLAFFSLPTIGVAYIVAGLAAAQAGVYANQIIVENAELVSFRPHVMVYAAAAVVLAFGPLLPFAGHLSRCRLSGFVEYGDLATDYTRLFHERWIVRGERSDLLGSADIQSLADLAGSYEIVTRTRPLPCSPKLVALVVVAAVAPIVPIALLKVPMHELLLKIGGALLGKGPG